MCYLPREPGVHVHVRESCRKTRADLRTPRRPRERTYPTFSNRIPESLSPPDLTALSSSARPTVNSEYEGETSLVAERLKTIIASGVPFEIEI